MTRAFICECADKHCRRKFYLDEKQYDELAKLGHVKHTDHRAIGERCRDRKLMAYVAV